MRFSNKKKPTNIMDNAEEIMFDFKLRAPFWSYRPVMYRLYEPFDNYTPIIDKVLEGLFTGEIDEFNGDTMDNMIYDMASQAEKDLAKQKKDHGDIIMNLDIRNKSDQKTFQDELTLLKKELSENEKKKTEINARFENDKFLGGKNAKENKTTLEIR